jgi:hypothetical protein
METKIKKCIICEEPIHPKRLEILPNTVKCVACSTTNKKAAITVTKGEGDHTYNETIIMDREEFNQFQKVELKINGKRKDSISHPDEDDWEEETDVTPITE